jgi:hypothetical protein
MKKKEKYYPVNNQEDEDGYTLHPGTAIIYENGKRKKDTNSRNKTESRPAEPAVSQFNFFLSGDSDQVA